MLVSRLIAAKPPPPSASQTPETRFVRYQNRYLGWAACHELLKHIPHALAHLIAAKPSQEQTNGASTGFRSYQMCWFGCVRVLVAKLAGNRNGYAAIRSSVGSVSMQIGPKSPGFCRLQPTRNFAAYLIAYKPRPGGQETRLGEGFVRYQI